MSRFDRAMLDVQGCASEIATVAFMAAAVAAAVLFGGCSSTGGGRVGDVAMVGSTMVVFVEPDEYDQGDRADVLEAVSVIQDAWSSDFSRAALPAFVLQILDVDEFDCGGVMAIGCTRRDGTVAVVRGRHDELPGLYHELCHRAEAGPWGTDIRHEDPRWPAWTERGFELAREIADRRSWW